MRLNADQIQWAAKHDWFIADMGNGHILICDERWGDDPTAHLNVIGWIGSFAELRTWAGYHYPE